MRHVRRRAAPASPVVARAPPSPPSLMSGRRRFLMGTTHLCWTRWPSCCLTRQMTTGTRPRRILTPIRGGLSRALCRRLVLQRLWSPHLRKLRQPEPHAARRRRRRRPAQPKWRPWATDSVCPHARLSATRARGTAVCYTGPARTLYTRTMPRPTLRALRLSPSGSRPPRREMPHRPFVPHDPPPSKCRHHASAALKAPVPLDPGPSTPSPAKNLYLSIPCTPPSYGLWVLSLYCCNPVLSPLYSVLIAFHPFRTPHP